MLAHSLRITGYDTEIEQREHAPQFLRVGMLLAACAGLGLFSFFRSFEHTELISTYGLWFLLVYHGIAIKTSITLAASLMMITYAASVRLFPDRSRNALQLATYLFVICTAFVGLYFLTTGLDRGWSIHGVSLQPLEPSASFRVYLTDDTFLIFLPLLINNALMGTVAFVRDGDFFATAHQRHFTVGIVPAALAFITMLPYGALQLDNLYLYVIGAAVGYVFAFALSLHFEYTMNDA